MKKNTTMGATDKVKANKGHTSKASNSYTRLFSKIPKEKSLKIDSSQPPSSVTASTTSTIMIDASATGTPTTSAPSTPNVISTTTSANPSSGPSRPTSASNVVSTSATTSANPSSAPSKAPSTNNVHGKPKSAPPVDDILFPKPAPRGKAIILMNNKPMAMFMRSSKGSDSKESVEDNLSPVGKSVRVKTKQQPKKEPPQVPAVPQLPPEKKGIRTFRVWTPHHRRRSIVVNIGDRAGQVEAEKVFIPTEIRSKSYNEWRKEAKALLPSNTGGPPIELLSDVVIAAPKLQKEEDPRAMQKAIKRLSIDSDEKDKPVAPKLRSSIKTTVDYTKVREVRDLRWEKSAEDDGGEGSENTKRKMSNTDTVLDLGGIDHEEEQRKEELEKKQAGIDIKGKIDTLRQLADNLSNKRKIRHQLILKATGQTVLDAEAIPVKEHMLYGAEYLGDALRDVFSFFMIWETHIRDINGRFGVVTANYFTWLRQMIGLEIISFILTTLIIFIPEWVQQSPEELDSIEHAHRDFRIEDLITGEGYFHHSYLYYTGYHHRHEDSAHPIENPAFRFLFCMFLMFLVLTYFIFSRLTRYYHTARMESTVSGVANMQNFKTIMCSWDFSCRDEQGKIFLHKTISREMKLLARASQKPETAIIEIEIEVEKKKVLAVAVKYMGIFWGPWAIHIIGNLVIIVTCVILGVILLYLCKLKLYYYLECVSLRDDRKPRQLHESLLCPNGDEYLSTLILTLPAVFASMTTLLLTKVILMVGDMESWNSPERKIYATMIRAGLFYFTNIGVFYTFWLKAKPELNSEGFVAEAIFGKELYRLVVIQGLIDVTLNLGVKGIYHLIRRKSPKYKMTEFRTEYCCLSMYFIHSISRIGFLFCPAISIFTTLRLIVDFYQNKFSLFHLSSHENYSIHVSQVYAPFLLTFFILCYLITSFLNVYYISDTIPSNYDGPFEMYNNSYDEVLALLLSSEKKTRWIADLAQPGFLTTSLAILGAMLYFVREWSHTYEPIIVQLNELIVLERGDRDLLLKAIFEIGKVTVADAEEDGGRLRISRIKQAAMLVAASNQVKRASEGDSDEEGDNADEQIEELIHHVQRRKSLGVDASHFHGDSTLRHSHVSAGRHHKRVGLASLTEDQQKHHLQHMQEIVARIVDARKVKSVNMGYHPPPSALPHQDEATTGSTPGHNAVGTLLHEQHDDQQHPHGGQYPPPPPPAPRKIVSHAMKDIEMEIGTPHTTHEKGEKEKHTTHEKPAGWGSGWGAKSKR